ncbi:uncharacterized protein METZ01_LOCUS312536, partial [marine metagenome]
RIIIYLLTPGNGVLEGNSLETKFTSGRSFVTGIR